MKIRSYTVHTSNSKDRVLKEFHFWGGKRTKGYREKNVTTAREIRWRVLESGEALFWKTSRTSGCPLPPKRGKDKRNSIYLKNIYTSEEKASFLLIILTYPRWTSFHLHLASSDPPGPRNMSDWLHWTVTCAIHRSLFVNPPPTSHQIHLREDLQIKWGLVLSHIGTWHILLQKCL